MPRSTDHRHTVPRDVPVIGISANVIDDRLTGGRVDGIGTYTHALERGLVAGGTAVRRVYAPAIVRGRLRPPPAGALAFGVPLSIGVAASVLTGIPMAGTSLVESGVALYHATDYRAPKLRRTPVVATIYDAIPHLYPQFANPRLRRIKSMILRAAAKYADLVIAVSNAVLPEIVEHYGISPERVRVIPLGVSSEWFEAPPLERVLDTLAERGLAPGYFLSVGTIQPRKNFETLLQAYDRLPPGVQRDHQLVIVGKYGWGAQALRTELLSRQHAGRCVWLDYENEASLRDLYAGAGSFIFPTRAEGFGLPLLEALASGLPVVASDLPVLREIAGANARFVAPGNADALAEAMTDAVEKTSHPPQAIAAQRARAREFSWEACVAHTIRVYEELV